ncbi:type II toxin-antitoxin system RelB/DinJ family antitoxin [Proteus vulgaris]|uniref:type II toxin-antitoxin system RelB/DinJ family antitoxin n=1 Tax=Proteus TaxID=583 RepID=UPI000D6978B3|nr:MULTISPECIES: type II toxin-antitoxin system RelB/DinJ family antitoxin [Proteus]MBQ0212712.1 type II toxin-antitoxin system RelB/DinJ family antitoxin [Proteus vulgaris]MDS0787798.1 type II toxin-antitoxin system RelB/DinJ family antitoxin [Proteus vulgaris]MDY3696760.1 type II toxin-antitoxin system RelB/DinJ family antitoxin [Proteus mirabilis]
MTTIQVRVDDELKKEAYQVFEKMNLSPSDAIRLFLRYVSENEKLPFSEVSVIESSARLKGDLTGCYKIKLRASGFRLV